MKQYVEPSNVNYQWSLGKDIIKGFNFPEKWKYDDVSKDFVYNLNVGHITVSPGFDNADLVMFHESDKWNAISVVMDIPDFDKEAFKQQVLAKCPQVIWPTDY